MKITISTSDGLQIKYDEVVKLEMSDIGDSHIRVYYFEKDEPQIRKDYVKFKNVTDIKVDEVFCAEFI